MKIADCDNKHYKNVHIVNKFILYMKLQDAFVLEIWR